MAGGVGIGGNAYVGGTLNVGGTVIASASGTSINGLTATFVNVVINSVVDSTNTNTGALQVQGGASFDYNVVIGGTTSATSTVTGALQVQGGVGIGGSIYAGNIYSNGQLVATGSASFNGGTVTGSTQFTNSTAATSTNSGAVTVVGGVGIGGNLNVGGTITRKGLEISPAVYTAVNSNVTITLGTTSSYHIINPTSSALALTLAYPASPADGTIISWTCVNNTNPTIAQSGGTFVPTFSGGASYGLTVKYLYNTSQTTWYRIQ